jgi:hypothetical protein
LLSAGQVISTRTVTVDELLATGRIQLAESPLTVQPASVQVRQQGAGEIAGPPDPATVVAADWEKAHQNSGDAKARVPREVFVEVCMSNFASGSGGGPDDLDYQAYVNALFDTATAMMLPAEKTDLGKHCFGYAALLAHEFYAQGKPEDMLALTSSTKPADRLAAIRQDLDADWAAVEKDEEGRVAVDVFVSYFLGKYTGNIAPENQGSFEKFLVQDFQSALAMMLPKQKTTLGGHCFRYASLMAGEFYFDGNGADKLGIK